MRRTWLLMVLMACDTLTVEGPGTNPGTPPPDTTPGTTPTTPSIGLAETVAMAEDPNRLVDSCSDLFAAVYDRSESQILYVSADGLVAEAHDVGGLVERTYTLPSDEVTVKAIWGQHVGEWYLCDDVVMYEPVIVGEALPISGTLTISVLPDGTSSYAEFGVATLQLDDVVFEDDTGDQATLDELRLEDLFVGWLPG